MGGGRSRRRKLKLRKPRRGKKKSPSPPWIHLPEDVTANILHRLGAVAIIEIAQKVCSTWRRVCQDPSMWRVIDMRSPACLLYKHNYKIQYSLEIMCRHAVDRSHGQLIDINIEYFGTHELMDYIARKSSHLRRLTLADSDNISAKSLCKALRQLPELEELSLFLMKNVSPKDMETIGKCCPLLKSFTYIQRQESSNRKISNVGGRDDDRYAAGVAKSMPNLRHLALVANDMTNEGLQAILDGCHHLESLDIRLCYGVDLKGALGERCSKQMKYLSRPYDPIADIIGWNLF